MNYYEQFSPEVVKNIKQLNDKLLEEERQDKPDNKKILKLKQQILMQGIEMSVGLFGFNYNPYKY